MRDTDDKPKCSQHSIKEPKDHVQLNKPNTIVCQSTVCLYAKPVLSNWISIMKRTITFELEWVWHLTLTVHVKPKEKNNQSNQPR
jgi:hypothetical protein